jgi:hypothetical protein
MRNFRHSTNKPDLRRARGADRVDTRASANTIADTNADAQADADVHDGADGRSDNGSDAHADSRADTDVHSDLSSDPGADREACSHRKHVRRSRESVGLHVLRRVDDRITAVELLLVLQLHRVVLERRRLRGAVRGRHVR